jgi:hypothetical protein
MNMLEYKLSLWFTHQSSDFNIELCYLGNENIVIKNYSAGREDIIIIPRHVLEAFLKLIK